MLRVEDLRAVLDMCGAVEYRDADSGEAVSAPLDDCAVDMIQADGDTLVVYVVTAWPPEVWHWADMSGAFIEGLTVSTTEDAFTFDRPAGLIDFCREQLAEIAASLAEQGEEMPPAQDWA